MNEIKHGWFWGPYSRLGWRVAFLTFLIDQLHKWWMLLIYDIREKKKVEVLPFLDLTFVLNEGISYSMLEGVQPWMLAAFATVASLALWIWLAKDANNRLMAISLGLLIGGALGNALDRLTLGGVADFFSLHAYGYYWYIFNIADVAIVAGVVGLLYESIFLSRNDAANEH
ncbi:MAG: signal peptidase II [Hyphomicrobiaceae bacterium]